jgi:hypothetical protein
MSESQNCFPDRGFRRDSAAIVIAKALIETGNLRGRAADVASKLIVQEICEAHRQGQPPGDTQLLDLLKKVRAIMREEKR